MGFSLHIHTIHDHLGIVQVVHVRIKSKQHSTVEANALRAAKDAAEENASLIEKKAGAAEEKIKIIEEKATIAEVKVKATKDRALTVKREVAASFLDRSAEDKLKQALVEVSELEKNLAANESMRVTKLDRVKALLSKKIAETENIVREQTELTRRRKAKRDRAFTSRAWIIKRAEEKLASTLVNATKEGFNNCLNQVSLCLGVPSQAELVIATDFLKMVRDDVIVEPDDEEPDFSFVISDLDIRSGGEEEP
ncbi:hypothetical protein L6164_005701 [Bauhinia variegata]|uniref:Uncharacterized protein n=1 Tax=Bauhinia variegata TaxID=167791 RepID=A0ACB9PS53_BAUVA|nr:hypothetical protein L6164_005701 [Bauhinia variegata]